MRGVQWVLSKALLALVRRAGFTALGDALAATAFAFDAVTAFAEARDVANEVSGAAASAELGAGGVEFVVANVADVAVNRLTRESPIRLQVSSTDSGIAVATYEFGRFSADFDSLSPPRFKELRSPKFKSLVAPRFRDLKPPRFRKR